MRLVMTNTFLSMLMLSTAVSAQQDFPVKPIRILAGAAGGSSDLSTRLIAQGLTTNLGQQVIVDSRPTVVIRDIVMKSPPDGYTLLLAANSFYLGPLIVPMSYDPVRDFAPVTIAIRTPSIFVVHPSLPVKNVKELVAMAKARPGKLNYASGAPGSSYHIGMELFKSMAGVNIVRIGYKGGGPALIDTLAGQVEMMLVTPASGSGHIKSGRLRPLGITSEQPSPLFPGMPTVASQGLAGFEQSSKVGVYAPAKTPAATIDRLNQEFVKVLNRADIKEKFREMGLDPAGSTPQEFASVMKSEMTRIGKLMKDAGIKIEE
jgi:tripartite-type tricarboxylate transporter receptor subunit TctC